MRGILLLSGLSVFLLLSGCLGQLFCGSEYSPVCGSDGKTYVNGCLAAATGISQYSEGACKACSDSENGVNPLKAGTAKYNKLSYKDYCQGSSRVIDYYCQDDALQTEYVDCPAGLICSEGACIPSPCSDSDYGSNIYAKGTAVKGGQSSTDYCVGSSVMEYSCTNDGIVSSLSPCPSDYICSDGACVQTPCTDTEAGQSSVVAGTVTKGNYSYSDYCPSSTTVLEYYCSNSTVSSTTLICPSGYTCSNGACAAPWCSDSDGTNKYLKSTASDASGSYTDYCSDSDTVREYYCLASTKTLTSYDYDCPSGYICSDGACVTNPLACTDSDGGWDIYSKGTLTRGSYSYTDSCDGDYSVLEYYCSNDYVSWGTASCPNDYRCSNGRCIHSPSCYDSDGTSIYTYGYVTRGSSTYYDYCSGAADKVVEYWCDDDTLRSTSYSCPLGYGCSGGVCAASCSDTDGGYFPYTRGTLTYGDYSYTDYCNSQSSVLEYYCSGSSWTSYSAACGTGYKCSNGACVYSP